MLTYRKEGKEVEETLGEGAGRAKADEPVKRRHDWTPPHEIKETRRAKRVDVDLSEGGEGSRRDVGRRSWKSESG
ncbi:hypothetical protein ACFFGV_07165 [Pontibacillus salicampi]|uniref:Uncharacterized protein n=1 Tax=Pontibacillus salicampi TaxID=1449801 RepID=A0ABV6LLT3_9BACI